MNQVVFPMPGTGLPAGHSYCKHFSDAEIMKVSHPDCKTCWSPMQFISLYYSPVLLALMDLFREKLGCPVYLTSGYRGPEYNKSIGSKKSSSHVKGLAFDFKVPVGIPECQVLYALQMVGFKRIGIGRTFYHVDVDKSKKPAIWRYDY